MANITTLGEGKNKRYKVTYELPRIMGERKRKSKTFPAGTSKAFVENFLLQKELQFLDGGFQYNKETLLSDYIENTYFLDYTEQLSPTTVSNYKRLYYGKQPYSIKNKFGNYKVKSITKNMMQKYCNELTKVVSPKTVRSYIMWLHSIFDYAITDDIIKPHTNPTDYIKLPQKIKPHIEAYTREEVRDLINLSADDYISQLVIGLGALAGLRRGEMAGLTWDNVNIKDKEIHITQNKIVVDGEIHLKSPKTPKSIRTIYIPDTLADILENAHLKYKENKLLYGADFKDENFVFFKPNGEGYRPDGISIHYERFMHRIEDNFGIKYKSLHKLPPYIRIIT